MAQYGALDASSQVVEALGRARRLRVLGAEGALRGMLLAAAARADDPSPVVFIAPDDATARTVASDTAFFQDTHTRYGIVPGAALVSGSRSSSTFSRGTTRRWKSPASSVRGVNSPATSPGLDFGIFAFRTDFR